MKKISAIVLCIVVIMALLAGCSLPQDVFGVESQSKDRITPGMFCMFLRDDKGESEIYRITLRTLGEDKNTLNVIYEPAFDDSTNDFKYADIKIYEKEGNFDEPKEVELESFYGYDGTLTIAEKEYVYRKGSYISSDFIVVLDNGTDKQYRICKRHVAQDDPLIMYTLPMVVWD